MTERLVKRLIREMGKQQAYALYDKFWHGIDYGCRLPVEIIESRPEKTLPPSDSPNKLHIPYQTLLEVASDVRLFNSAIACSGSHRGRISAVGIGPIGKNVLRRALDERNF